MPLAVLLAGILQLTACRFTVTTQDGPEGGRQAPGPPAAAGRTVSDLQALRSEEESHADSYDRDAFGRRWADLDGNGCGQRDDVLARDLSDVRRRDGSCTVVSGRLVDPWTGAEVAFTKAEPSRVQIDHVVSLAEAWRSGAWSWTDERRERYANDLSVLLATAGDVNRAKGDRDAATWSPAGAGRSCAYARHVVDIKTVYGLSVDRAERSALLRALEPCS